MWFILSISLDNSDLNIYTNKTDYLLKMIFRQRSILSIPIPMTGNGLIYFRIILIHAFISSLMFKPSPNLKLERKIRNSSSDDVDIRVF